MFQSLQGEIFQSTRQLGVPEQLRLFRYDFCLKVALSQLWYSWDMNAVFAESLERLLKQCYKNCECDFLLTSTRYLEVLMRDALVFTNSHPG